MDTSMSNKIILKRTFEAGKTPLPSDLEVGELAINAKDGVIFSKDDAGEVFQFGARTQKINSIGSILTNENTLEIGTENAAIAIKGGTGLRVIADQNTKTLKVNLDNPDAFTLEGKRASEFAAAGHHHNDQYVQIGSATHTCLSGKWYRLFEGQGRCNARFTLGEGQSSQHGYVRFEAGVSYGSKPYINVVAATGNNNGNGAIRNIRIVSSKEDQTYGNVAIEVFVDADCDLNYYMDSEYSPHTGWSIKSPAVEVPAEHPDYNTRVAVDCDKTTGFHSTGAIFENGRRVYSPNFKPTWNDVTGKPSTMPPSEHNHNDLYYLKSQVDAKFDEILAGASEELNSFKELADALQDKGEAISAINSQLATKANKSGDTFTGKVTFNAGIVVGNRASFNVGEGLEIFGENDYFGANSDARVIRLKDNNGAAGEVDGGLIIEGHSTPDDVRVELLRIRNNEFKWKGATIWHAANDGAGSGLDADLLDGQHGAFYRNASNLNAGVINAARLSGHYGITVNNANNANTLGTKAPEFYTNASNLASGTVPSARLSGTYAIGISGNAATASKWSTKRTLTLTGDVSGSVAMDGSGNVSIATVVANDSHTHHGSYYQKSESDGRYIKKSGDTMTGALNMGGSDIVFNGAGSAAGDLVWKNGDVQEGRVWSSSATAFSISAGGSADANGNGVLTLNTNNTVRIGGKKVYTEHEKPTAAEVGLGNVPNTVHTASAKANTVPLRDGSADIHCRLVRSNYANQDTISGALAFRVNNGSDNYIRFCSNKPNIRSFLEAAGTSTGWDAKQAFTVADANSDPRTWNGGKMCLVRFISTTVGRPSDKSGVGILTRYQNEDDVSGFNLDFTSTDGFKYNRVWTPSGGWTGWYTVYNSKRKPTLGDIGASKGYEYTAKVRKGKWSRIALFEDKSAGYGGAVRITIGGTRVNEVYQGTFDLSFSHSFNAVINVVDSCKYSPLRVRAVVDAGNKCYFEVFGDNSGEYTDQSMVVSLSAMSASLSATRYTAFTDGTTIPSGFTSAVDLTTVFNAPMYNQYPIYHTGNKPTKSDVGLGNVNNWDATSSLTSPSAYTYATAKAVYDVNYKVEQLAKYPTAWQQVTNSSKAVAGKFTFNTKVTSKSECMWRWLDEKTIQVTGIFRTNSMGAGYVAGFLPDGYINALPATLYQPFGSYSGTAHANSYISFAKDSNSFKINGGLATAASGGWGMFNWTIPVKKNDTFSFNLTVGKFEIPYSPGTYIYGFSAGIILPGRFGAISPNSLTVLGQSVMLHEVIPSELAITDNQGQDVSKFSQIIITYNSNKTVTYRRGSSPHGIMSSSSGETDFENYLKGQVGKQVSIKMRFVE